MKLPIKKKYFDLIKSGEKCLEYRDAHLTFVCEETGDSLRMDVEGVHIDDRPPKYSDVLEDDKVIVFELTPPKEAK
jgi:hypothetical protein